MWRIITNRRHYLRRRCLYPFIVTIVLLLFYFVTLSFFLMAPSLLRRPSHITDEQNQANGNSNQKLTNNIAQYRYERYEHRNDPDTRPGAWGRGHNLGLTGAEREREINLTKKEAFNILVSEQIPLNRTMRDLRMPECRALTYDVAKLPTASVVLVFYNEPWSTLMRTAHSIINRSPPELLKEVVLVDDFSDREELADDKLDVYAENEWPDGVVKVVHLRERSGLIVARQRGAEASIGDVVVFLDAHCEVSEGWLEPILQRISEKRTAVVCPMIGDVNGYDFHITGGGGISVGGFSWSLQVTLRDVPKHELKRRKDPTETVMSPTMTSGLLGVERSYFFELGGYDTGMGIWGGENLEISFRTWMCGGSIEIAPCSQVTHVSHDFLPYTFPTNKEDSENRNLIRVAESMMGDYKRFYYWHRRNLNAEMGGDVSERLAIRKRLSCKSFKWYLNKVYPEKFIPDEQATGWGHVKNEVDGHSLCLDLLNRDETKTVDIGIYGCQNGSFNQIFSFSFWNELRREKTCAYLGDDANNIDGAAHTIPMRLCTREGNDAPSDTSELWRYDRKTGHLIHQSSGRCITTKGLQNNDDALAVNCDDNDPNQKWAWEHIRDDPSPYNPTAPPP